MLPPAIPLNEHNRLRTLRSLDVLDTPPEERFDRLTRLARRLFQVPISVVSLVDMNRQWFKSCIGLDATETSRDISFCGHAILQDDIFVIPDALEDPRFADNPLVTGAPGIRFYAGCPLVMRDGSKVGTLCIIDSSPRTLGPEDFNLLRDLASMAEQELAALEMATVDELTRISNRRGFLGLGKFALEMCRRQKRNACLLMIDLDRFKEINDRFGHAEGDAALVTFAEILTSVFRGSDVIGRLGGDEFAVLLTDAQAHQLDAICERLRSAVDEHNALPRRRYQLEYSVGSAWVDLLNGASLAEMLSQADDQMYVQKRQHHIEQGTVSLQAEAIPIAASQGSRTRH